MEVNRYLNDDDKRFAGPKMNPIVTDLKFDVEIMIIEISSAPHKSIKPTILKTDIRYARITSQFSNL